MNPCAQARLTLRGGPDDWHRPEPRPIGWVWHLIGCLIIPGYVLVVLLNLLRDRRVIEQ